MVLGIGYTELLIIAGGGVYLIGSKDLPRVARMAGRATGRAVTYISALRNRAFTFAEETELNKLHAEIQASMQQLNALRSEMRSGVNIFRHGQTRMDNLNRDLQGLSTRENFAEDNKHGAGPQMQTPTSPPLQGNDESSSIQKQERPYQSTRQVIDYTAKATKSTSSMSKDFAKEDKQITPGEGEPKPD